MTAEPTAAESNDGQSVALDTEATVSRDVALLELFRELGQAHRLHITLMFGQVTVFLAATGGLYYALLGDIGQTAARAIGGFGLLLSFVFFVHHERVYAYSKSARDQAIEVQKELGIVMYAGRPSSLVFKSVNADHASRLLYSASAVGWMYILTRGITDLR